MKHFLIFSFVALFTCKAAAQNLTGIDSLIGHRMLNQEEPALPTKDVIKHIGEDVYIYDNISGHKTVNDSLKLLYVGGLYPHHLVTIIIKGKQAAHDLSYLQEGSTSHFSGKAVRFKGKPAIVITNSIQLGTRIQI